MFFELGAQRQIDECEQHDSGFLGDGIKDLGQLFWGSYESVDVFDWAIAGVLRRGCAGDSVQGFSGCIGNKMHVEISSVGAVHELLINCGKVPVWLAVGISFDMFGQGFPPGMR